MVELDIVKLKTEYRSLPAGTTGTVVLTYDSTCVEVEFFDNSGNTIGVYTTPTTLLESVTPQ